MNKKILGYVFLVAVLGILLVYALLPKTKSTPAKVIPENSQPTSMQSTDILFSKTPDYKESYPIFPTKGAGADRALDGFEMKTENLGNNFYRINLVAKAANYKTQILTVSGDQKVYFVEKSFGDDQPGRDYAYGDDYVVAVDSQGYILK